MALLYHTGVRASEAATLTWGAFRARQGDWRLEVMRKGRKWAYVSVNSALLSELHRYRTTQDLSPWPAPTETGAVIGRLRTGSPLTRRSIGRLIEQLSAEAEAACPNPQLQAPLRQMTTHWLRHTHATHRLLAGASLTTTQDELGHTDPATTRRYAKTLDQQRRDDAEKLAQLK